MADPSQIYHTSGTPPLLYYKGHEIIGGTVLRAEAPPAGGFPEFVVDGRNSDSGSTSRVSGYVIPEGATADNYILDLTSLWFRGTNKYTSSTTLWIDDQDRLCYTWTDQSGTSKQFFNIYYIEDPSKLVVLSDWTVYDDNEWHDIELPNGIALSNCILDFKNVHTGGWSSPSGTTETGEQVKKIQSGYTLKIKFPIQSDAVSVECRVLYLLA